MKLWKLGLIIGALWLVLRDTGWYKDVTNRYFAKDNFADPKESPWFDEIASAALHAEVPVRWVLELVSQTKIPARAALYARCLKEAALERGAPTNLSLEGLAAYRKAVLAAALVKAKTAEGKK